MSEESFVKVFNEVSEHHTRLTTKIGELAMTECSSLVLAVLACESAAKGLEAVLRAKGTPAEVELYERLKTVYDASRETATAKLNLSQLDKPPS